MTLQRQTEPASTHHFTEDLYSEVLASRRNNYTDNYDLTQLGPPTPKPSPFRLLSQWVSSRLRGKPAPLPLRDVAYRTRKVWLGDLKIAAAHLFPKTFYKRMVRQFSDINFLYQRLADSESKKLLLKLFAYRILGHRKVKLPRNSPQYWRNIESLREAAKSQPESIKIDFQDMTLKLLDLKPFRFNLEAYATPEGASCAFVQKQYEYHRGSIQCKAEPGDVVIDAGGCWGDTGLYFAHEVGPNGKVYCFEFIQSNLSLMRTNFERNPQLAERIEIVERPLWSQSDCRLYYVDRGPASRVDSRPLPGVDGECRTLSIDDLVEQRSIERVDFIKMDIEGAELDALKGAEKTLRRFAPKLAICVYHQTSDFTTIPEYLASLNVGYEFHLDHHTIHLYETVLFAIPASRMR